MAHSQHSTEITVKEGCKITCFVTLVLKLFWDEEKLSSVTQSFWMQSAMLPLKGYLENKCLDIFITKVPKEHKSQMQ